ncbi:lysylphosphatidylglycerol synthase transmembrane domain-containing protein [Candidatus Latescibacterota bacterium]
MVVVVLFSILIYSIRPDEIYMAFKGARPRYLFYAVLLMIPNLLLQFLKWRFILKSLEPRPSLKTTAVSLFGGFFLGASTPGRTGELARGLLITGHSKLKTASLTVVDKGFNQLLILLFGLTAVGFLFPWPYSIIPFAVEIAIITIMLNIHRTRPYLERFFHRFTKSESVDNALAAFDMLTWRKSLGLLIFTTLFYATFSFQFYCLIRCFSDFSLLSGIRTIPVIYVINTMFPVAIGDFGVKEMAAVHVLGPFGIAGGPAFSATITQNVITFLVPSLIGGIVFMFSNPLKNQEAPASDDHKILSKE